MNSEPRPGEKLKNVGSYFFLEVVGIGSRHNKTRNMRLFGVVHEI